MQQADSPVPPTGSEKPHTPDAIHLWLILVVTLVVVVASGVLSLDMAGRQIHDTDGYMRLVRVLDLAEGQAGWFDSIIGRSNAPLGHTMHWTRVMDVVLLALAGPFLLFGASIQSALYGAAVVVGPILLVGFALAVAWAARPVVGSAAPVAGLIAALQPAVGSYSVAGRPDHHSLIALSVAVVLGGSIRMARADGGPSRRVVYLTAIAGAVGLLASPEVLIALGFSTLALVGMWLLQGRDLLRKAALLWSIVGVTLVVLTVVERGSDVAAVEYDRLSLPHVVLALLVASGLGGVARFTGEGSGLVRRAALLAAAGAPSAAVMFAWFPGFFRGPFADVPTDLSERWLNRVAELAPLIGRDGFGASDAAILFLPAVGAAIAVWMSTRETGRTQAGWVVVAAWAVAGFLLTVLGARFGVYSETVAAVAVSHPVAAVLERLSAGRSPLRTIGTVVVVSVAAFSWFAVAELVGTIQGTGGPSSDDPAGCSVGRLASGVGSSWSEDTIVLAAIDRGPELLYRTGASVVGSPYHRNADGILDTFDLFEGPAAEARATLDVRHVDIVLVCPGFDAKDYPDAGSGSLYEELSERRPPSFLEVAASGEEAGGFLVYRFRPAA